MERLKEIRRLQKINRIVELVCVIPLTIILLSVFFQLIKQHCKVDFPLWILCIVLGVVLYALLVYKEKKLSDRLKKFPEVEEEQ